MIRRRYPVTVPKDMVQLGLAYGRWRVKYGVTPKSRRWGADKNPLRQARSRIGEASVFLHVGIPIPETFFEFSNPDPGYDLTLPNGRRPNVKTTFPPYRLLWPMNDNKDWFKIDFDGLVSVSIEENDYSKCTIEGWVPKPEFLLRRSISPGDDGLDKGTWYMHKRDLHDIGEALAGSVYHDTAGHFRHYCHCGEWGAYGYGRTRDSLGQWYCRDHRPDIGT